MCVQQLEQLLAMETWGGSAVWDGEEGGVDDWRSSWPSEWCATSEIVPKSWPSKWYATSEVVQKSWQLRLSSSCEQNGESFVVFGAVDGQAADVVRKLTFVVR